MFPIKALLPFLLGGMLSLFILQNIFDISGGSTDFTVFLKADLGVKGLDRFFSYLTDDAMSSGNTIHSLFPGGMYNTRTSKTGCGISNQNSIQ